MISIFGKNERKRKKKRRKILSLEKKTNVQITN